MRHFEQILSCCSAFVIVSISVGGIAKAPERFRINLLVDEKNVKFILGQACW